MRHIFVFGLIVSEILIGPTVLAQESYNAEILNSAAGMGLYALQDKVDAANDPGVLGIGFLKRCRAASVAELEKMLGRTKFQSNSYNYAFNELLQRGLNPVKKYSNAQIESVLNQWGREQASSTVRMFESEYCLVRLRAMSDAALAKTLAFAPMPSYVGELVHREIELRKVRAISSTANNAQVSIDDFGQAIKRTLDEQWPRPESNQWSDIVVGFRVDENGQASMIRILKSCGDQALDQKALDVVRSVSPFKPLPTSAFKPFGVEFTFQGLRNHRSR